MSRRKGISSAKAKLSRELGVPLTRSGRQKKLGRELGCAVPLLVGLGACLFALRFS